MDRSLNVSLVNQLLGNSDVTVTLQWPREPGVVYHIIVLPEIFSSHTKLSHSTITTNLTISYNIQYNVSIVSSLCGVTTTKVFNYGKCKVIVSSSCTTLNHLMPGKCVHNKLLCYSKAAVWNIMHQHECITFHTALVGMC